MTAGLFMLYELKTPEGPISISKNVIGRIVFVSVRKLKGKVIIANRKGKTPGIGKKPGVIDAINNMDITMGERGLDIKLYVVINFGTSIGLVTDNLISEISSNIRELTGLETNSVAVFVKGMISNQQVSKRNIEVKG